MKLSIVKVSAITAALLALASPTSGSGTASLHRTPADNDDNAATTTTMPLLGDVAGALVYHQTAPSAIKASSVGGAAGWRPKDRDEKLITNVLLPKLRLSCNTDAAYRGVPNGSTAGARRPVSAIERILRGEGRDDIMQRNKHRLSQPFFDESEGSNTESSDSESSSSDSESSSPAEPSTSSSSDPSTLPSAEPSASTSSDPSLSPSSDPSTSPSAEPSASPSSDPSTSPSSDPGTSPSVEPSASPSSDPTALPTPSPGSSCPGGDMLCRNTCCGGVTSTCAVSDNCWGDVFTSIVSGQSRFCDVRDPVRFGFFAATCASRGLRSKTTYVSTYTYICTGTIPCTGSNPAAVRRLQQGRSLKQLPEDKSIPMKKDLVAVAFTRVPKTGSTTMLKFIKYNPSIRSWPQFLSDGPEEDGGDSIRNAMMARRTHKPISCVFGYAPTTAHLGSNFKNVEKEGGWWNECPHVPYPGLVKSFSDSLGSWSPPEGAVLADGAEDGSFSVSFKAYSMVRDPFDRLVSYFYYLTKFTLTNQFLKDTVTPNQYERVKARDLVGWMELLHSEGGCGLELPYQYRYFHRNVDTAIDLIRGMNGDAPKIFILVNECFEPSLRLLAHTFEGFELDAVDDFIQSDDYHSNTNKNAYENVSLASLKSLRAMAEVWFNDDFKFYEAATHQFTEHLAASGMDASHLEGCKFAPRDE